MTARLQARKCNQNRMKNKSSRRSVKRGMLNLLVMLICGGHKCQVNSVFRFISSQEYASNSLVRKTIAKNLGCIEKRKLEIGNNC